VDEVADIVAAAIHPDRRIVVGITGAPGAGKSTLAEQLVESLNPRATLVQLDGFHLTQSRLTELGRRDRMGAPDTFDVEGFRATLIAIRRGFGVSAHTVLVPGFDREIEEPIPDAIGIAAGSPCVVIEGNYLLLDSGGWERTAPLLDLTLFVDLADDVRLERLIARHERFGKSHEDARAWALGPDEINARLIAATSPRADYRIALG
jgi:pantothenate kinase